MHQLSRETMVALNRNLLRTLKYPLRDLAGLIGQEPVRPLARRYDWYACHRFDVAAVGAARAIIQAATDAWRGVLLALDAAAPEAWDDLNAYEAALLATVEGHHRDALRLESVSSARS